MKAPRKLIDESGEGSAFLKDLLREGRAESMPLEAKAAAWKGIALHAPGALATSAGASAGAGGGTGVGAGVGVAAAKGVTAVTFLKGTAAAVALAGGIWGGHHVVTSARSSGKANPPGLALPGKMQPSQSREDSPEVQDPSAPSDESPPQEAPAPSVLAPAASAPAAQAPTPRAPATRPDRETPTAPARAEHETPPPPPPRGREEPGRARPPLPATPSPVGAAPSPAAVAVPPLRASHLAEESQLVLQARQGLKDGHAAAVFRQLEVAKTRFPGGALAQEREALAIEALWRMGQSQAAQARTEAFSRTYPDSPHAAQLRQITQP